MFLIGSIALSLKGVKAFDGQTKRLYGKDRYETCSQIVNDGWKTSDYAVIVNGQNFPDALSASTLAKKYNAPILLTQDAKLDGKTYFQLKRLGVKKAFIVGGNAVVKPFVEKQLHNMNIVTKRYYGANRSATSIAIAKEVGINNGVIITTGNDFTDALSISPIAAKLQIPIILVSKNSIDPTVKSLIDNNNIPKTYILGGEGLISNNVASQFPNWQRIEGFNKFDRNINIIKAFKSNLKLDNIYFAYSEKFADALSGSAIAAMNGNPIILVGNSISDETLNFMKDNLNNVNKITVLGGNAGIKDYMVNQLSDEKNINSTLATRKDIPCEFILKDTGNTLLNTPIGECDSNELWVRYENGKEEFLVSCRESMDHKKSIYGICYPALSVDNKKVYFCSAFTWATSGAIHVIDIQTKEEKFICEGNYVKVIHEGPYYGNLIVSQHRYYPEGGSHDTYYIVDQEGNKIKELGDDPSVLEDY